VDRAQCDTCVRGLMRVASVNRGKAKLAWRSLALAWMAQALVAGCFDAPPEYTVPGRIPPVLNSLEAVPSLASINLVDPQDLTINFNVPFRSEDAGQPLQALFIRDFVPTERENNAKIIVGLDIEPSLEPFQDQTGRVVAYEWNVQDPRPDPGCHSVTLIFTYDDNIASNRFYTPLDDALVATETWWFVFETQNGSEATFECRPSSGSTP
jgi:hypothetical protein